MATVTIKLEDNGQYAEFSGPAEWREFDGDDREAAAEAITAMCREAIYGVLQVTRRRRDADAP